MKSTYFFSIALYLVSSTTYTQNQSDKEGILLQSSALSLVDGKLIDADIIEQIKRFQRKINNFIWGNPTHDGQRIGHYQLNGKHVTINDLAQHTNIDTQSALNQLLKQAKNDFVKISDEFKSIAAGAKPIMAKLIQKSCEKRKRTDSLLLIWAHTKEEDEAVLFDQHVKNFKTLKLFCIDLLNFLSDLCYNCPKAYKQYMHRVHIFKEIKSTLPNVLQETRIAIKEEKFYLWVKHHLDSLQTINYDTVRNLVQHFVSKKDI